MAAPFDTLPSPAALRAGLRDGPPGRTPASVAAARAAVAGLRDWRAAWEACVARGLLPLAWAAGPPFTLRTNRTGLRTDPTPAAVAAVAADPRGLATALALLPEWNARFVARGAPAFRPDAPLKVTVVDGPSFLFSPYWSLSEYEDEAFAEADVQAALGDLTQADIAADATLRGMRGARGGSEEGRLRGAFYAAAAWPARPNLFAPPVAAYALGYVPDLDLWDGRSGARPRVYYPSLRLLPLPRGA